MHPILFLLLTCYSASASSVVSYSTSSCLVNTCFLFEDEGKSLLVSGPRLKDRFINITETDVASYVVGRSDSAATDTGKTLAATSGSSTTDSGSSTSLGDTTKGEETGSEDEGEYMGHGPRQQATCSLRNKSPGVHCDAYTCIRGGGRCYMGSNGRCVGERLSGPNAPVACLACACRRDR
ncbi:hypothetical protein MVEN_01313000 [Mycena venus]|uniref:Uncharacterized protein n=1 Tax=Mycena venus TaxID=2733690 RepID=A0A8H7CTR9_9AGAR|nr:hypothetical protein MVEN_01313000 [Mycena venus]